MKNLMGRNASQRVTTYFKNAGASYDKRKWLLKAEKQKIKVEGEKKAC